MSDIELAPDLSPREVMPEPERFELYNRERRKILIDALTPKEPKDGNPGDPTGSFVSDAARHAGMPPRVLRAWLEHGERFPTGPLGRFYREVAKLQAQANDNLRLKVIENADKAKKWDGIARIGEQFDPETWKRPSEGTNININVGIMAKLEQVHEQNGRPVISGD